MRISGSKPLRCPSYCLWLTPPLDLRNSSFLVSAGHRFTHHALSPFISCLRVPHSSTTGSLHLSIGNFISFYLKLNSSHLVLSSKLKTFSDPIFNFILFKLLFTIKSLCLLLIFLTFQSFLRSLQSGFYLYHSTESDFNEHSSLLTTMSISHLS